MANNERTRDHDPVNEYLSKFRIGDDHRALVIIVAAAADDHLRSALLNRMRPTTGDNDELFDGDAPLSSFSAKIRLCYRLSIIDEQYVKALTMLRKIRNDFAHHPSGGTLEDPKQRDRVQEYARAFGDNETLNKVVADHLQTISPTNSRALHQFVCYSGYLLKSLQQGTDGPCPPLGKLPGPPPIATRASESEKPTNKKPT